MVKIEKTEKTINLRQFSQKKFSLAAYLSAVQIGLVVLGIGIISVFFYIEASRQLDQEMGHSLKAFAEASLILIDADQMAALQDGDDNTPYYRSVFRQLQQLKKSSNVKYIYTMRLNPNGKAYYIVDSDNSKDHCPINEEYGEPEAEMLEAFQGKTVVEAKPVWDQTVHIWSRSGYAPIKNSAGNVIGIVGVDMLVDQVQREKRNLILAMITIELLTCGVAVWAALFSSRRIVTPLNKLLARLNQIAASKGDLSERLEVPTIFTEIGVLEDSVNQVQDNSRHILLTIFKLTQSLEKTSQQLLAAVENVGSASEEITAMMTQVHDGADTQSANVADIARVMTEMTDRSSEVVNSVAKAREVVSRSAEAAAQGENAIQETLVLLHDVADFSTRLNNLSSNLHQHSDEIRKMLSLLSYISRHTKILSLNANIEAAKAGVYGQGFAVVAREIRNLAENSQTSLTEMTSEVTELRNELDQVVAIASEFYGTLDQSGNKIQEAETELAEIKNRSGESLVFTNRISQQVQIQLAKTDQTNTLVQQIAEISKQFAVSSDSVVTAVTDQDRAIQGIVEVSRQLQAVLGEVKAMIGECKLE